MDTKKQTKAATEARVSKQKEALRALYEDWRASGQSKLAYAKGHGTTQDRIRRACALVEAEAQKESGQLVLFT